MQKNNVLLNSLEITYFFLVCIFFLYYKDAIFNHWSYALDHDITLIYNGLLLSSNLQQEYLDHPAYSTALTLNLFYQFAFFLNITDIETINDLLNHKNKNDAIQNLYNISLVIHLFYAIIFLILSNKILNIFIRDRISSLILTSVILFSPAFIHLFDILRSEILSIIYCLLFFIFLEKSLKNKNYNTFISGFFFTMAMLAKVQIIFCVFGFSLLFYLKNFKESKFKELFSSQFIKSNIKMLNVRIFLINIIFCFFMIFFCLNYFYKIIDGIFFVAFFLFQFFILTSFVKKAEFVTTPVILFFSGSISSIFILKNLSILGLANSFHPELLKIISSPISQSANISSGYQFVVVDKLDFIKNFINFFKSIPLSSHGKSAQIKIIFNNLSLITYTLSFLAILYCFIKKKRGLIVYIVILNIFISLLNFVFAVRPYQQYLIYSYIFNLILISVIFDKFIKKKEILITILIIYILIDSSNIASSLNEKRPKDGNMKNICQIENLENNDTYMRIFHRRFDKEFMYQLCESFIKKN